MSHEDATLDLKFLMALIKEEKELRSIACIPDVRLCVYRHATRGTIYVDGSRGRLCPRPDPGFNMVESIRAGVVVTVQSPVMAVISGLKPRLWAPPSIHTAIETCRAKRKRFCVLNLGIHDAADWNLGHSNALIVDLKYDNLEVFDPQGRALYEPTVRRLMEREFPQFKYVGGGPRVGIQSRADAFEGLCSTYTSMFVVLRLKNPHLTKRQVESLMVKGSPETVRTRALRFNAFMADKLRRHRKNSLL